MHRDDAAAAALVDAVRRNCRIADARHATDLSLCIYLLQMRELYRWEHGLSFTAEPERARVAQWLAAREALWSGLEGRVPMPLPVETETGLREFDAADVEGINAVLLPRGLIYGAGLASADRPTYFLALSHASEQRADGLTVRHCATELARTLFAPPALLAGGHTVLLRRESLARWLWEKFEAFSLRRTPGPMQALLDHYALPDRAAFVQALPKLVDDLSEGLVLHEVGEHRAGLWLGAAWAAMRLDVKHPRTDLAIRAVRDHLADLEVTLPALLQRGHSASLHLWFANYDGLRRQLLPSLGEAYARWRHGDGGQAVLKAVEAALPHFRALAAQALALHALHGPQAAEPIERLLHGPEAVFAAET
jgi:hypothetical protein